MTRTEMQIAMLEESINERRAAQDRISLEIDALLAFRQQLKIEAEYRLHKMTVESKKEALREALRIMSE